VIVLHVENALLYGPDSGAYCIKNRKQLQTFAKERNKKMRKMKGNEEDERK
jgi:hypothetical protein